MPRCAAVSGNGRFLYTETVGNQAKIIASANNKVSEAGGPGKGTAI